MTFEEKYEIIVKMDCKYWHNLRNKDNKSKEELMLLESRNTLLTISEIVASYNKGIYDSNLALNKIKNKVNDILTVLE